MRDLGRILWAYLARDAALALSYPLQFLLQSASVLLALVSAYFMSLLVTHHPALDRYGGFLPFGLIGMVMTTFFYTGYSSFSSAIRNEQLMGTLEAVLLTPARLPAMLLASAAWNFAWAAATSALLFGAATLLFHLHYQGSPVLALLFFGLTLVIFSCFGVISASFTMVFKRGDPLSFLAGSLSYLLGGVIIPVSVLPPWLQRVSQLLPVTHGLTGLREVLLRGASFGELWPQLLFLLVFAALIFPLSLFCFTAAVRLARRAGSLPHY